ncbi:MAG: lytic murein transglycosylase [Bdellovibrionales bacterium]|nr:lytic murein transglycosylase [Bdellovibrionales bacterium]
MFFRSLFMAVLLQTLAVPVAHAADKPFPQWMKEFKAEARQKGISDKTLAQAMPASLKPIDRIIELDRKQPEGTTQFDDYLERIVSRARVEKGITRMLTYPTLLGRVSNAYGVEKEVIVALWGVETNYGDYTGGFDIVNALATLAYDGRRSDYFRGELINALKILDEGHIKHENMKGSWAGAMGQVQFMPSSFFRFAEDFNGDGRRDIWTTQADVFASAANYLAKSGWKKGQPWGRKVSIPDDIDRNLLGVNNKYSLQYWHDRGVRLPDGKTTVPFEGQAQASIVQPSGPGTSAYMVYENFQVILKWNRSSYFATSVLLLSERLRDGVKVQSAIQGRSGG